MKRQRSLRLWLLSLTVLASVAFVPAASASIYGHLSVANCAGGGIVVNLSTVNFVPDLGGFACAQVSVGTNLNSTINPAETMGPSFAGVGDIYDLPVPGAGPGGFMTFTGGTLTTGPLVFLLGSLGPGIGLFPPCVGLPTGDSCSVNATSQFILTATATGTSVTLLAGGTVRDLSAPLSSSNPLSFWNGALTSQISGQTPAQIQTTILGGGSITSSFSGEFNVVVPEPVSMVLIGGGLIALAAIRKRKLV